MSWNNRVSVNIEEYNDGCMYTASIHEVYYIDELGVGSSPAKLVGNDAEDKHTALLQLKNELELMLESVNYAIEGKTEIFDMNDISTFDPGAKSVILKNIISDVLDYDDEYMDEKYGKKE